MPSKKSHIVTLKGEELELFPIGTLAECLGRTPQTIRKWEISGFIPESLFKDRLGRRMYTAEQIELIVECARLSRVRDGVSIVNTSFPSKVHKALAELNQKYL